MSESVVEIEQVSFSYRAGQRVLSDVSMTVRRGQLVGIMGQSGCGKTTLLRIIGGALKPTEGSARVLGALTRELDGDGLYALRRKMGMLFQFGALFTDMSVFDNVAFQMREHTDLSEDLIHDLVMMKLQAVGLRGVARRVALARAIALDPHLMLYDEPFTGLDPISFGVIGRLIRELNDALGATSIIVSHDVQEALEIVDYCYFVADGRIVARGTPAEIHDSGEPFVDQFVHGKPDGPVPFHYRAPEYATDLELEDA